MSRDKCAAASTFAVTSTIYVTVKVNNPDVIERVTGPEGDEWRSQFYPRIESAEDVAEPRASISGG